MNEGRRTLALELVREIAMRNKAAKFVWYKPSGTEELSCYWDHFGQNVLWVTNSEVHVLADSNVVAGTARPTNWSKQDGKYVGWLLPGASRGAGGGKRPQDIATVMCPEMFIAHPAGSICDYCDVVHEADEA